MRSSVISFLFAAFLAPKTFAALFVTSPTEATECVAVKFCQVTWIEKAGPPNVTTANLGLYTGNGQQYTLLQALTNVPIDTSKVALFAFTPDPSVGPNDNRYFIGFQSTTLKDPVNHTDMTFSPKFTLSSMTGKFNASVESQLAGITASPTTTAAQGTATATRSAAAFVNRVPISTLAAVLAALGFMI